MNPIDNPFSTLCQRHVAKHIRNRRTLCCRDEIQTALQMERLRADRSGRAVSVVIFETRPAAHSEREESSQARRVAALVLQTSRVTDVVGMLSRGEERICAILPDTSSSGTTYFADRVRARALRDGFEINVTVYSYPTDSIPTDSSPDESSNGTHSRKHRRTGEQRHTPSWRGPPAREAVPAQTIGSIMPAHSKSVVLHSPAIMPLSRLLSFRMPLWKRSFDIVGALIGIIIFSPVMLIAAALIRLSTRGPIIFTQRRAGWRGREFTIYKFRTMTTDAEQRKSSLRKFSEQDGPAFKMTHDPRVTVIGRFLRATSLDELPQFWNVLVGNMSLVGPRPLPVEEANACSQWHRRRLDVMPGLTCIWQVRGRSSVAFDDWMRMDMEYIDHRSPLRDLSILLLTIPAVTLRKGAH